MAGKHRKSSRPAAAVAAVVAPAGLAAAAVAATSLIDRRSSPARRAAVAPIGRPDGADHASQLDVAVLRGYDVLRHGLRERRRCYGEQQVVPFLPGPQGIANAIKRRTMATPIRTGVTASGWGAGQTGTALGSMIRPKIWRTSTWSSSTTTPTAPAVASGRRTTLFAPLLLTSAEPTPNDLAVHCAGCRLRVQHQRNAASRPAQPVSPSVTVWPRMSTATAASRQRRRSRS